MQSQLQNRWLSTCTSCERFPCISSAGSAGPAVCCPCEAARGQTAQAGGCGGGGVGEWVGWGARVLGSRAVGRDGWEAKGLGQGQLGKQVGHAGGAAFAYWAGMVSSWVPWSMRLTCWLLGECLGLCNTSTSKLVEQVASCCRSHANRHAVQWCSMLIKRFNYVQRFSMRAHRCQSSRTPLATSAPWPCCKSTTQVRRLAWAQPAPTYSAARAPACLVMLGGTTRQQPRAF